MTRVALLAAAAIGVLSAQPAGPAARVTPYAYDSRVFGGERRLLVYLPPADAHAAPPSGVLICLWGQDYAGPIDAPATLDAMIRGGEVPPLAAIFLDDPDDRFQDFQTTEKTARSIAGELLPWVRKTLRVTADARHTIVAGYSAAGLAATYTAYAHADVVGNVLAQSGAYWRGFDGSGASEPEWLALHYASAPLRPTRFSLEVGGAETRAAGGSGLSLKTANEHLRDALLKRGYTVFYREVPGGQHEYGHWKAAFGPALAALTKDWR